MYRYLSTLVIAAVLGLGATMSAAVAQSPATGTLVGHLAWCKDALQPVGQSDAEPSPLADVTPGMAQHPLAPVSIRIPASNVQVSLLGTGLTATTDTTGGFTLNGVPAAQSLTLVASAPSGPALVLNGPGLVVAAGQTRDLGSVGLVGCDDGDANLTVAPVPTNLTVAPVPTNLTVSPAPTTEGAAPLAPVQPAPAPEIDAPAQQADPGLMTDGSN